VHAVEQSPFPSAVREALLHVQQPRACCSSDELAVPPFAFPAEGTGNICFLFKFKGIYFDKCNPGGKGISYCPTRTLQLQYLLLSV